VIINFATIRATFHRTFLKNIFFKKTQTKIGLEENYNLI